MVQNCVDVFGKAKCPGDRQIGPIRCWRWSVAHRTGWEQPLQQKGCENSCEAARSPASVASVQSRSRARGPGSGTRRALVDAEQNPRVRRLVARTARAALKKLCFLFF